MCNRAAGRDELPFRKDRATRSFNRGNAYPLVSLCLVLSFLFSQMLLGKTLPDGLLVFEGYNLNDNAGVSSRQPVCMRKVHKDTV